MSSRAPDPAAEPAPRGAPCAARGVLSASGPAHDRLRTPPVSAEADDAGPELPPVAPGPDLGTLLQALPVGVIVLDAAGRIVFSNPASALLGRRVSCRGSDFFRDAAARPELQAIERAYREAMAAPEGALDAAADLSLSGGEGPQDLRLRVRKVVAGESSWGLVLVDDDTRAKQGERDLAAALGEAQDQAVRDPLTGLFNRRHLETVLRVELRRADRNATPVSLAIADVDHFKRVNDTHGHPTGDNVLVELSRVMSRMLRVGDTCGRLGGEEFCAVFPHTHSPAALLACERLRRVVHALRFKGEPDLRITVSLGLATTCGPLAREVEEEGRDLLARADAALYRAKQDGRDRTVVASLPGIPAAAGLSGSAR